MRTAAICALVLLGPSFVPAIAAFDVAQSYDVTEAPSSPPGAASDNNPPTVASLRRLVTPPAQGFGDGIPLAFALRQIVPRGVRLTLANGVDPDARVSWQGGRPWTQVLGQAVAPLGLRLASTRGGWILRR